VAVEVEMVIPPDDPSEPCYEPETVQLLKEVREQVERGDLTWAQKDWESLRGGRNGVK
jgi:hypothetical protein